MFTTQQRHAIESARFNAAKAMRDQLASQTYADPVRDESGALDHKLSTGKITVKIGRQFVKGLAQFPVHVTFADEARPPYTVMPFQPGIEVAR